MKQDNTTSAYAEDDQEKIDNSPTVGSLLHAAREKCGLSIDDIASQLHLRPSLVEKFEADIFDGIVSPTYARGYIRNYAKMVDANEDIIMACLEKQIPSVAEPAMQSFSRKTSKKARDSRLMIITYLIAILLLALLVVWWVQKSNSNDVDLSKPSAEEVAASEQVGAEAAGADIALDVLPAQTVDTTSSVNVPIMDKSATSTKEMVDLSQKKNEVTAPKVTTSIIKSTASSSDEVTPSLVNKLQNNQQGMIAHLTFSLNGNCWMKVDDATGKSLIHGVKKAGEIVKISGVEPVNFVIGAPQSVQLTYNGKSIDLDKYPNGRVARFSLPQS